MAEAVGLHVHQQRLVQRAAGTSGRFAIWDVGLGAAANAIAVLEAFAREAIPGTRIELHSFDLTGVLGFGGIFYAWGNTSVTIGLRFAYSFTDVTKHYSPPDLAALQESAASSYAVLAAHYTGANTIDYNPTHRASAGIFITIMNPLGSRK